MWNGPVGAVGDLFVLSFLMRGAVEVAELAASADRALALWVPASALDRWSGLSLSSSFLLLIFPGHLEGSLVGSIINIYYNLSKRLVDCVLKLLS